MVSIQEISPSTNIARWLLMILVVSMMNAAAARHSTKVAMVRKWWVAKDRRTSCEGEERRTVTC